MEKITVAVIGCGRIADSAHFPALSKIEGVEIKYACDIIESKAQDKVERFGAKQAITDYKVALADPALVSFKDFEPIGIGGPVARSDARVTVPVVSVASGAVVLGHLQVQDQQLIALTGVLEGSLVGGLDAR